MPELDKLVAITLDKERHLRLTLKGMLEFEKITGKSLMRGFKLSDLSMEDNAALIWASLIHEDKELTYDDVLYMVDLGNIVPLMDALTNCVLQAFPELKEVDKRPLTKRPRRG